MSYTYLQAQAAESSADSFADIAHVVRSRLSHSLDECSCSGNVTAHSLGSRCGMMSEPSTVARGEESPMLFAAGSHARTLAPAEKVLELTASEAGFGERWQGWFAKWNPDSCSWKTRQCSLLAGLDEFSETWPKWGSMRSGECAVRTPPDFRITDPDCGWLPTPTKTSGASNRNDKVRFDCLAAWSRAKWGAGYPNPRFWEKIMGWPISWTDAQRLETDKFQAWQRSHGVSW